MDANYETRVHNDKYMEENYYVHERLNKNKRRKIHADVYRYLEESTDNSNPIPSFFSNEDETINRVW